MNFLTPPPHCTGEEVYQVCCGRISSCEEGKGIIAVGKKITWKKRERGSNIIFPAIFRLLERISSGEMRKVMEILGKKI